MYHPVSQVILTPFANSKGENGLVPSDKYQVKGKSKQTTVNVILFQDVSKVFGLQDPPASNPHLMKAG